MFKYNVKYVDFNGKERAEDLHFHLSLPEVTRIEAELGMPVEDYIKSLTENQNLKDLLAFIEKLLLSSYGRKTQDGRSFQKTEELRKEFEYSQAYAELFEEMLLKPELAKAFGEAVADNGKAKKNYVAPQVVNQQ